MAILVDNNTRVLVQGMTGREGSFHAQQMLAYGTKVVAGVTPGKGGSEVHGVPVFNYISEAVRETGANVAIGFVPGPFAADSVMEAADAVIPLIVCIAERVPLHDEIRAVKYVADRGLRLIGPNCPGLIAPGSSKVGIMPGHVFKPGPVGVVSRSGTLTYEIVNELTGRGIGQSTVIGVGGDPVIGSTFVDILRLFDEDPQTEVIVLCGEIGGTDEEAAAEYIGSRRGKPVVGFISGRSAPPGKRMGHAGAIISGGVGGPEHKVTALNDAGVPVADTIAQIGELVGERLHAMAGRMAEP